MRNNGRHDNEIRNVQIEYSIFNDQVKSCRVSLGITQVQVNIYNSKNLQVNILGNNSGNYIQFKEFLLRYLNSLNYNFIIDCHLLYDDGGVERGIIEGLNYLISKIFSNYSLLKVLKIGSDGQRIILDLDSCEEKEFSNNLLLIENDQGEICSIITSGMLDSLLFTDMIKLGENYLDVGVNVDMNKELEIKTIVIATQNKGKAQEFKKLFEKDGYAVKTLLDFDNVPEIVENGATFTENAKIKANVISEYLQLPVLGDDSGLCVDALKGMPGIFSARYAGDHDDSANNAKLLSELAFVDDLDRTAHFHTSLVFSAPGKEDLIVEGEVEGLIAKIPRGENGFGYDPLFYLPELDKTMAELSLEQKNQLSHRAVAISNLKNVWKDWLEN